MVVLRQAHTDPHLRPERRSRSQSSRACPSTPTEAANKLELPHHPVVNPVQGVHHESKAPVAWCASVAHGTCFWLWLRGIPCHLRGKDHLAILAVAHARCESSCKAGLWGYAGETGTRGITTSDARL